MPIRLPQSATRRVRGGRIAGLLVVGAFAAEPARAQLVNEYFPSTLPGYQNDITLLTSPFDPRVQAGRGIQLGDFNVQPSATEGVGFSSNPLGYVGHGSSTFNTSASVSARSDWLRDSLGANLSVNNQQVPEESIANRTNWSASVGGSLDVGEDVVSAGYSHLGLNLSPTDLGVLGVTAPVPYSDDDVRADDSILLGRVRLIPAFDYENFSFGSVSSPIPINYGNLNHQIESGTLTSLVEVSGGASVVAVIRGTTAQYVGNSQTRGNYADVLGLAGIDFDTGGLFRVRALIGGENRSFDFLPAQSGVIPTAELDLIWQATRLTTVTATFSRAYQDPTFPFAGSEVTTFGRLQAVHELRRNVDLTANLQVGSSQINVNGVPSPNESDLTLGLGFGANWRLSRFIQLSAGYGYSHVGYSTSNGGVPNASNVPLNSFDSQSVGVGITLSE